MDVEHVIPRGEWGKKVTRKVANYPIYRKGDKPTPAPIPPQLRSIDRRANQTGERIGDRFSLLNVRYFRPEYKYATPPHTGSARNPLIFGKIPKPYLEREHNENVLVLHRANNRKHKVYRIPKRKLTQTL